MSAQMTEVRYCGRVRRRIRLPVAPHVRGDRAEAGVRERGELVAPGVPELRPAMAHDDRNTLAGLRDVHADAVRVDDAVSDFGHRSPGVVQAARLPAAHGRRSHRRPVARAAPSTSAASFAHTTLSATISEPAKVPNPQSVEAIRARGRPPPPRPRRSGPPRPPGARRVGRGVDHAGQEQHPVGQGMALEHLVLVLVARLGQRDRQRAHVARGRAGAAPPRSGTSCVCGPS